jgi:hypothetical protein
MAIVRDQLSRLLRRESLEPHTECIVCRRPIKSRDRRMTVRGSVQVHQGCATYRMRQVTSDAGRAGHPPR